METLRKSDVLSYLEMASQKGLLNANTAGGWKAAVNRVLELMDDQDDVSALDVHGAVIQFNNRHPGAMTPESLRTYEVRVGRAIKEAARYKADPAKYRAPTTLVLRRKVASAPAAGTEQPLSTALTTKTDQMAETPEAKPMRFAADVSLALPFPLRPGFLAQVVIPRDLTKVEADRMCAFIQALAQAPTQEVEQV